VVSCRQWPVIWDACPTLSARSRPSGDGAHRYRPDLSLELPPQLQAVTHQLARTVDDLAWAGPGQRPDLALVMREQMPALERDLASGRAMTCGANILPVGDSGLRERLGAAMRQARARVPDRHLPRGTDSGIDVRSSLRAVTSVL